MSKIEKVILAILTPRVRQIALYVALDRTSSLNLRSLVLYLPSNSDSTGTVIYEKKIYDLNWRPLWDVFLYSPDGNKSIITALSGTEFMHLPNKQPLALNR